MCDNKCKVCPWVWGVLRSHPDHSGTDAFHPRPVSSLYVAMRQFMLSTLMHGEKKKKKCRYTVYESQVLSDEVVGEPVHKDGLRCGYSHGQVHPQLVPGSFN